MKTALAVVPAAVILLAGCTATGGATDLTSSATAGSTAAATSDASGGTTAPTTTTTAPASLPTALPTTFTDVNQTITDTDLKDTIRVVRIARQLPWPEGYQASAQAYELVALELTWTPSKDYTIPIRKQDFAINTGSQFPNPPDPLVNETIKAAGWALLPDSVDRGDPVSGWVVFKVDPRNAPRLVLDYTRPAVQVTSGGSGTFPAKTFSVTIAG